jgi:hypothetical protein
MPPALVNLRARLSRNRTGRTLYDTPLFCRDFEAAYLTFWERCRRGEGPANFDVEPELTDPIKARESSDWPR